jgi:hypothetical protein
MERKISVPVLLVAFNRPDTTLKVFECIRNAKPTKLYIALDGPRKNKEGEEKLCKSVKEIVENIDWPCQTHYLFNSVNKGAEITVSSAITWVFEKEEYAIILEDDIVAPLSFFSFAQDMLMRYKDEDNICIVTGNNFTPIKLENSSDYFFGKYGHTWGWATWKRVWDKFDLNMEIVDERLKASFLESITNSKAEMKYYKKLFSSMQKRGIGNNTWDFMFLYLIRINKMLSIIPRVNLTSNIGIYGLHARGKTKHHYRPYDEDFIVKKHPKKIECLVDYDIYHFKTHINKKASFYSRVIRRVFRFLTIKNNLNS